MAKIKRAEVPSPGGRKKTTCPKNVLKSKAQKNTELALKLLRAYSQIY